MSRAVTNWRGGLVATGLLSLLLGCGAGDQTFDRSGAISGTMTLDGQPVEWASLTLTGERNEATQEVAMAMVEVRDGIITSPDGAEGTSPGQNQAQATLYAEDPAGKDNPQTKGVWNGMVNVEAGKPLAIEIASGDLTK